MIDLKSYDVIDLTNRMYHLMPGWPTHDDFIISYLKKIVVEGYTVRKLSMNTHHGTHIDTECHMIEDGRSLDDYPLTSFMGEGVVLDLSKKNEKSEITDEDLKRFSSAIGKDSIVMLHTGWYKYRKEGSKYLYNWPYVGLSAANYLVNKRIKMVGTEGLSIAGWSGKTGRAQPVTDTAISVHQILLSKGIIIVEEMANLDQILKGRETAEAFFVVLPLKIEHSDGSPVRAIAFVKRG